MSERVAAAARRAGLAVTAVLPRSWIGARTAVVIGGRVWLARGGPRRLETLLPDEFCAWLCIRVGRQYARRRWRWHLLWLLSRRFRWDEDKAAWMGWLQEHVRRRGPVLAPPVRLALLRRLARRAPSRAAAHAFLDAALEQARARSRRRNVASGRAAG